MNILLLRWAVIAFVVGILTVLSGCCVPYYGGYDNAGGTGAAYYEPYYGGWGPGYHVAPYRGGDYRPTGGGGHAPENAYRSAPASRSVPSLPSHGGGHGGGGGRY